MFYAVMLTHCTVCTFYVMHCQMFTSSFLTRLAPLVFLQLYKHVCGEELSDDQERLFEVDWLLMFTLKHKTYISLHPVFLMSTIKYFMGQIGCCHCNHIRLWTHSQLTVLTSVICHCAIIDDVCNYWLCTGTHLQGEDGKKEYGPLWAAIMLRTMVKGIYLTC